MKYEELSGRHRDVYDEKLKLMHTGPCSSPKVKGDGCPCPHFCPLHGRCCDCVEHHRQEALALAAKGMLAPGSNKHLPNCMRWFDQINGIGCVADPDFIRKRDLAVNPDFPMRDK